MLSDYAKGVLTPRVVARSDCGGEARGVPVIVDPKATDYAVYRGATVITPNRRELADATRRAAVGDAAIMAAAEELAGIVACEAVVVTRSEEGMSSTPRASRRCTCRPMPVKVRDVSGPGDTVVAMLAVMLALGADYESAMRAANAGAAVVVGKPGTATVSVDELRHRLLPAAATALEDKIVFDRSVLGERLAEWRRQRLRIGFTNGCFDLLHRGHIQLMAAARSACDRLVVGLNSDASVTRLKGEGRPIQDVTSRADVLAALEAVDLVVVFEEDTPLELIAQVRPDRAGEGQRLRQEGRCRPRDRRGRRRRGDPGRSPARPQHEQHGRAVGRVRQDRHVAVRLEAPVPRLSAIIITKDEAANIGDCLDSLAFCDERIVVDAASSDGTMMIAKQKGARVATHGWNGFGPQKNYALSLAQGDWVLSIDADERVTPRTRGGDPRRDRRRQGRRLRNSAPFELLRAHDAPFGLVSRPRAAAVPPRQGALHRRRRA